MTTRHIETLGLMAEGFGNAEIARRLGVHEETVKSHVKRVLGALGARNRAHAAAIGVRWGIIP